jgi:ribosomal-protein-alanine N-acetyltransferase
MSLDWTPPTLETERLILRPVTPDDGTAVFLYASNPNLTRFTLFETHQTIDDSRWFVTDYVRSRYANREPDPFGIVPKRDPVPMVVGALGAHWASQANGTMEMGYSIAEPYWGRGLVVEAARAVVRYVFTEYAVERLQARVIVGNDASERVLQKLGFTREGVLRSLVFRRGRWWDIAMYSLLRAEWEAGRRPQPDAPARDAAEHVAPG